MYPSYFSLGLFSDARLCQPHLQFSSDKDNKLHCFINSAYDRFSADKANIVIVNYKSKTVTILYTI